MNTPRVLTALIASAIITACTQLAPQKPVQTVKPFGAVELSFGGGSLTPQISTVQPDSVVAFDSFNTNVTPAASVAFDSNFKYILRTFAFTNTTNTALNNLTLYAYHQSANNKGGTAIKNLVNFAGGNVNDAQNAQSLLPTHGMSGNGTVSIVAGREDLQVFQTSEAAGVQTQSQTASIISSNDRVLEYGFVTRSLAITGGRTIGAANCNTVADANCNRGQVTVAYKIPSASANTAYGFSATFVLTTESDTRVSRSPEESTLAAAARATALAASQVVLVGQDTDTTVGEIRLSNAKISTTPALLLEPSCNTGSVSTTIPQIQGSGSTTAATGTVAVEGVVTGDFQDVSTTVNSITTTTNLSGFYLQDRYGDGNTNTSDGILVFGSSFPDVAAGDFIRVSGTPTEFTSSAASGGVTVNSSLTQLTSPTLVQNCGTRQLPEAIKVNFPVSSVADLEKYEGMRVSIPDTMTVTEIFQLGRFGQVVLSSDGASNATGTDARLDNYTQFNTPSVSGYATYLAEIAKRKIYLDDGRSIQNPDPILLGRGGNPLSATNTLRGGDTVANLSGILDERFEGYRIQPTAAINFQAVNARPTAPTVGGTLRVASFNVLNFFTTLNQASFATVSAGCSNTIAARGADTAQEFTRQKDKIVQAILAINPDVLGVIEMQNNGTTAINDLVAALNTATSAGTYAAASAPANGYGCDAIKVDFIYKPSTVTLGTIASPNTTTYSSFGSSGTGRSPVAATFTQISNSQVFTAVMNHFKSKGSGSGAGNTDSGDGQGLSNLLRTQNATDLKNWLATNPTGTTDPDYLLMGDFNAYYKEQPLTTLETAGYTNLNPSSSYSYVFDGTWGSLDHALGSATLTAQVAGAEKLHINADEPIILDYNTEFKSTGQVTSLYAADAYRSSDHDPVVVGLNLGGTATPGFTVSAGALGSSSFTTGIAASSSSTITINRTSFVDPITLTLEGAPSGVTGSFSPNNTAGNTSTLTLDLDNTVAAGTYPLTVKGTSGTTTASSSSFSIVVVPVCTSLSVTPNAASITVGATQQLTAAFLPSGCATPSITWSNGGSVAATVNTTGLVSGAAVGSATITANAGTLSGSSAITVTASVCALVTPFTQNWSNAGLITANDDWSGVSNIVGYRGDNITAGTGTDPRTLLADDTPGVLDVNANQTDPSVFNTGGVAEFAIANPVVGLAGSGTADAPYLLITINTLSCSNGNVAYSVRDIDGSADDAVQQVALHYRVGNSGAFTNIASGYIADATTANAATQVTNISVALPAGALGQSTVQLRIMTTNAVGNDEFVGIDDINITGN